jgi:hypothetical protein
MYVAVYNATSYYSAAGGDDHAYPDPTDPSSYQFSTRDTEDDHVFIPGPHKDQGVVIIAVKALSPVRFTIIVSSSNQGSAILLQGGVPQSHFVEAAQNELFKYYPSGGEDLRITVSARSGDPDLFVSTQYTSPHCTAGAAY